MAEVKSEQEAQARMIETVRQYNADRDQLRQKLAEQEQQYQYAQYQLQQFYQQQQNQQPPATTPSTPTATPDVDPFWTVPSVNERELAEYRTVNDDGEATWKPNTPAEVRAQAEQYERRVRDYQQEMLYNPESFRGRLEKLIESRAQEVTQKLLNQYQEEYQQQTQQQTQQQREQEYYSEFLSKNNELFKADPITREVVRDTDGYPVFSDTGAAVLQIVNTLESNGLRDPQVLWDTAISVFRAANPAAPATPPEPTKSPQEIAREQRRLHLQRGAGAIPDRSGTLERANGAPPQNPNLSSRERFMDRLSQVSGLG